MAGREVSELLYDGESVERTVEFGSSRVVVTSHRVLAFTPEVPGPNFRKVDRPNVENVSIGTDSARRHLVNAVGVLVLSVPFLAAGRLLSFDGMFEGLDTGRGARAIGVGTGFLDTLGFVFGLIDDALLWTGVACLVLVIPFALLYLRSRTTILRIHVAGGDDVSFAVGNTPEVDRGVQRLRHALGFGPAPAEDGTGSEEVGSGGTDGAFDAPDESGDGSTGDRETEYGR